MTLDPDQPTDEALASALRAGDDLALNALMTRWQVPLRSFLYRHTHNQADALDLAQETFVRIYRHRGAYREGARFSTWMFQIAFNLARDHARRHARRPQVALDAAPEPTDVHTPQSDALSAERAAAVRSAIAELPEQLRAPLLLSEYENLSHAEIGEIVRATPKAIETRIARARAQLRQRLTRWLVE